MNIQMANFNALMYEEAVQGVKQIKTSNQRLQKGKNSSISLQAEKQIVEGIYRKITQWLNKIQDGYLDPPTIRKVMMVKEQLNKQYRQHKILTNKQEEIKLKNNSSEEEGLENKQQTFAEVDFEMERKMLKEKQSQINEVQKNLLKINSIIEETSNLVDVQGQQLDIIDTNTNKSHKNAEESNEYLRQANEEQKKSNSKCIYFLIIFLIAVVCCLVFFFIF